MGKGFLLYLICAIVVAISRKPSTPIGFDIILFFLCFLFGVCIDDGYDRRDK